MRNVRPELTILVPNALAATPKPQAQGQAADGAPAIPKDPASASNPVSDTEDSKIAPAAKAPDAKVDTAKAGYTPKPLKDTSTQYDRIGFYHASSQTVENLVFLGNHGGQGSGVFD